MPREPLTAGWSFDPGEGFDSRVVEASKQWVRFEAPVRTIWADVFGEDPDRTPAQALADLREDPDARPADAEVHEEADGDEVRFAAWYREAGDERPAWGLTAHVLRPEGRVLLGCYVDEGDDGGRDWALGVWRSVRFDGA